MKFVIIIGASGHSKVIADIIQKSGDRVIGFLEDNTDLPPTVLTYPILGPVSSYTRYTSRAAFIIAIGNAQVRERIAETLAGVTWYTAVHPMAVISRREVSIGSGTVVMATAVINSGATIGKHCIINTGAIVEHDNQIEDYVHVSVGAKLAGTVSIGKSTWIGIGACVSNNHSICSDCVIGAGAVVVKDIVEPGTYVGVPAKRLQVKKRKICFVTTVSMTLKAFVVETAKYLHEHGNFDITFICQEDKEFAKSLPKYIHYYPVPMKRGVSLDGIKAIHSMRQIFKREGFELVQYSTPNASLYAAIAATSVKIPVRLYCQWGMVYVGFSGIKRSIFKLEEQLVCGLSTWIEPDSKSNLKLAHREGIYPRGKGSVIWNGSACGVDLLRFDASKRSIYREEVREQYRITEDAYVYGFIGRLKKEKGINELLEVARELLNVRPNAYLMLVGDKEEASGVREDLYNWACESDRVLMTGHTDTVEKYLAAMDCYILPSYREGFGMGVIEAGAMGLPVIVTNIPGPMDAMRHKITGIVVKKADVSSLKRAMIFLIEHPEIGKKLGSNAKAYVEENFEQQQLFGHILVDRIRLLSKGKASEGRQ